MPMDPIGASPSSTLSPDRRPAARLPAPMPTAAKAVRNPVRLSLSPMTCVPNSTMSVCSSAPRNQKYDRPSTVSQSTRSRRSRFRPSQMSRHGFGSMRRPGADAGTCGMRKLRPVPRTAAATTIRPISHSRSFQASNMTAPQPTPTTMATNVLISSTPFARESSRSGSASGRMPYLAGLKKVACSAIRNSTAYVSSRCPIRNAYSPRLAATISSDLVTTSTVRLL